MPRTDVDIGLLRVRRVTPSELDACFRIRRAVFIEEQSVPEALELDGLDGQATQFLAEWRVDTRGYVDDGWEPVGTARLRVVSDGEQPVGKAERVAVLPGFRGRGVGQALMSAMEADARRKGLVRIKLASQQDAIGFYERLGYRVFGEPFMDAGIPHRWMDKRLDRSC
ncbi:MAG: GNAT family N-acetyltransferase [Deltaproteobacteria bacterium]|nr:MAG: GNAT family N-acetyltransferase [Deltaproteobacteria bacterium]